MAMRELDFPTKVVQRDGWSECESTFLINCYNQYRDEIGKNKSFKSKKECFEIVAGSMAKEIASQKTPDQVSNRFYTLTRKPKNYNRLSSDRGSTINMNDTTSVDAPLLKMNEIASADLNSPVVVNFDGTKFSDINTNDANISMPVSMDGTLTPIARYNESNSRIVDESSQGNNKIASFGMLSAFSKNRNFPRFSESYRNHYSNVGIATVYNMNTDDFGTVNSSTCNPLGGYSDNSTRISSDNRSSLSRNAYTSSSSTVPSDSLATNQTASDFVSDQELSDINDIQSYSTSNVDRSSINCTITSGALSSIQTTVSDFASPTTASPNPIITNVVGRVGQEPLSIIQSSSTSEEFSSSIQRTPTVFGRPVVAVRSHHSSASDGSVRPIVEIPPRNLISSNRSTSSINDSFADDWTKSETEWLLEKYYQNMDEVGPLKKYRTKKDMWQSLAEDMCDYFPSYRTGDDLSKRVQCIINQKKKAVDKNRTSGASRVNVEYEDLINKIASIDDSIEPEVLRDANSVYYKEKGKKDKEKVKNDDQRSTKKPRWDKPNKKAILGTLSDTMLSIEKRREEREKLKEERRQQAHLELLQLLRSGRSREN